MIGDLWKLITREKWEAQVPLSWLLHLPGAMNAKFAKKAKVETAPDGDDALLVKINGESYIWPRQAPLDDLLAVVAELAEPMHPHQYFWGATQVKAGDVVLDIGSCEGTFAAIVAAKGANVIAIEPSPRMQRIIRRLFQVRHLPEPRIAGCALGATSGSAALIEDSDHPAYAKLDGGASGSISVPLLSLDDFVEQQKLEKLDFIKCDAEGMDVDIIVGGKKTLERFRPKLVICTYHEDDHFNRLAEFLDGLDYNVQGKGFLHSRKFRVMMLHAW